MKIFNLLIRQIVLCVSILFFALNPLYAQVDHSFHIGGGMVFSLGVYNKGPQIAMGYNRKIFNRLYGSFSLAYSNSTQKSWILEGNNPNLINVRQRNNPLFRPRGLMDLSKKGIITLDGHAWHINTIFFQPGAFYDVLKSTKHDLNVHVNFLIGYVNNHEYVISLPGSFSSNNPDFDNEEVEFLIPVQVSNLGYGYELGISYFIGIGSDFSIGLFVGYADIYSNLLSRTSLLLLSTYKF